ncbi:MAG: response regulator transcription factor [Filimonas sp.]|nr:response regulator transcription factor [Filimonas sp.]
MSQNPVPVKTTLSTREIDVLRLLIEGNKSREIGNKLGISELTVQTHRRNMMRKLDVNFAGLIAWGIRHKVA